MRALVIGYGRMGHNHARVLRDQRVEVVTVDPDPAAGADHTDLDDAPDCDLALVSVPPRALAGVGRRAASKAPRLVMDKPMATTRVEARELLDTAAAVGTEVQVAFTERANPGFRALRKAVSTIGPVRYVTAERLGPPPPNWECDPGVDLAGHCFDMARTLGFELGEVEGAREAGRVRYRASLGEDRSLEIVVSHRDTKKVRTFSVAGRDGVVTLDKQTQRVFVWDTRGVTEWPVTYDEPLQILWREILDGRWRATGEDGATALELSLARRDLAFDAGS
jgi:predicted dehydrogenase